MRKNIKHTIFTNLILTIISALFVIPILILLSTSFTSERMIIDYGYSVFPRSIDFSSYKYVFSNPDMIVSSYKVTILVSALGTLLSLSIMIMCAYALTRKCFILRKQISFFLYFTMLFNGGLIPEYILKTQYLRLNDTIWVMILSSLVNVWYIFILRTFINGIPESIIESAMLDGANEFKILYNLILPLSKPVIATIGLFVLLGYWNEWMTALLYINKKELYPLQYLLQKILQNLQTVIENMNNLPADFTQNVETPTETVRMAMIVIAAGPMLFIMPFFQKYFVRGMVMGAVKG